MFKAEKKINNQHHNFPWPPDLHDSIQTVSIWKSILSQFKTELSFQKQIDFYLSSLSSPISIEWKHSPISNTIYIDLNPKFERIK